MATTVAVQDSFLASAYELPKEITKKVFKALRNFVRDPRPDGLHVEKLSGRASDLLSIRVDDDYRIIFRESETGAPVALFVGKHDVAYRFADHARPMTNVALQCTRADVSPSIDSHTPIANFSAIRAQAGIKHAQVRLRTTVSALMLVDDLASLVSTRKYLPLAQRLMQESGESVRFTFEDIEKIIGDRLPPSARKHRPWWGNESSPQRVQAVSWMAVGWKVETVDLSAEVVVFIRR